MLNRYRTCKIDIVVEFTDGERVNYQQNTEHWRVLHGEFMVDGKQFMSIDNADDFIEKFLHGRLFRLEDIKGEDIESTLPRIPFGYWDRCQVSKESFLEKIEIYGRYSEIKRIILMRTYMYRNGYETIEKWTKELLGK